MMWNSSLTNYSIMWNNELLNTTTSLSVCQEKTQNGFIFQAVFLIVILIATFLGNTLVVFTVYLDIGLRSNTTGHFIASLAVSDLLVSLVSLPLRIDQTLHNMKWCLGEDLCAFWIWSDMVFSCASVCNLAAISIDRLIYITEPLTYQYRMTKRAGYTMIAFVWSYSVLIASLSFVNWTNLGTYNIITTRECARRDPVYYTVVATLGFFLPLVISVTCYTSVLHIAVTQANRFKDKCPSPEPENTRASSFFTRSPMIVRKLVSNSNALLHYKATKTLAIVLGVFFISWCPFFIVLLISLWCNRCNDLLERHPSLSKFIKIVFVYTLPAVNSTLNPIIYTIHNSQFRIAFRRQLRKVTRRQDQWKRTNNLTHQLKNLNDRQEK